MKPKTIKTNKKYIKTSCYFDSILEIFISAYFTVKSFKYFIDNNTDVLEGMKCQFITTLFNYVTSFSYSALYAGRAEIITNIYNPEADNHLFTWTKSVSESFEYLIFPNIFKESFCTKCQNIQYEHFNRIKLKAQFVSGVCNKQYKKRTYKK